jgi:hypothetical protein
LCLVKPALADLPNFRKSSDYLEISEKLTQLLAQPNPTPEVSEEIATLKFLQYTIESGTTFGQCVNSTGKVLGIYGHDSENAATNNISQLYFLSPGQSTDNSLDCDGFYLAKDSSATFLDSQGKPQNVKGAKAIAILDGTRLVVTEDETSGKLVRQFKNETHQPRGLTKKGSSGIV